MYGVVLIFMILNIFMDIETAVPYKVMVVFALVTLASSSARWGVADAGQWRTDRDNYSQARTLCGLSKSGDLLRLCQMRSFIETTPAQWKEWISIVDSIGGLVMMAGYLS